MLQHDVREGIHAYVHEHPDARFEQMRRALGLSRGALSFHLRVLEREGYLASRIQWTRRAFRAVGAAPPAPALDAPARILGLLGERAMGAAEVAAALGVSRQLARYHLQALERRGLVRVAGAGRGLRYRPAAGPGETPETVK